MVRRILTGSVFALLSLLAIPAVAQTNYTMAADYNCRLESHYPIFSFDQFFCNVVPYVGADGNVDAKIQFGGPSRLVMYTPFLMFMCVDPSTANLPPAQEKWHFASITETGFTEPANGNPGSYAFDWQGYEDNGGYDPYGNYICGTYHHGSASGGWFSEGPVGRGWYYPRILAGGTLTVTQ